MLGKVYMVCSAWAVVLVFTPCLGQSKRAAWPVGRPCRGFLMVTTALSHVERRGCICRFKGFSCGSYTLADLSASCYRKF